MKKITIVLLAAVALSMLLTGTAFANFAIHGSYTSDTDACAGCHRAHTSFSAVARTEYSTGESAGEGSALLVGSATNMSEFCYTCHGDGAPGASTNVEAGVFDAGPSAPTGVAPAGAVLYSTDSVLNAELNGGGFGKFAGLTSMHNMDEGAATDPMWGQGSSAPAGVNLSCTGCHDPHGSSNYRLLKDTVGNGVAVGGYLSDNQPTPYVLSAEIGYPANGWSKHVGTGAYKPDYTTTRYRASSAADMVDGKGMSGWCAGCHEQYNQLASSYDYGSAESDGAFSVGPMQRHRHPVNVTLEAGITTAILPSGNSNRTLATDVVLDDNLPLELRYDKTYSTDDKAANHAKKDFDDYLGCLTCHKAHGTDATMSGFAQAKLDHVAGGTVEWTIAVDDTLGGVNPNFSSALLRVNNRGVCERCHNK